jgi:hypothetical protein
MTRAKPAATPVKLVPLAQLKPHPRNPRRHDRGEIAVFLFVLLLSCTGRFSGEVTAIAPVGQTFSESRAGTNIACGGLSFAVPESIRAMLHVGDSVWGRYDLQCKNLHMSAYKHNGMPQ